MVVFKGRQTEIMVIDVMIDRFLVQIIFFLLDVIWGLLVLDRFFVSVVLLILLFFLELFFFLVMYVYFGGQVSMRRVEVSRQRRRIRVRRLIYIDRLVLCYIFYFICRILFFKLLFEYLICKIELYNYFLIEFFVCVLYKIINKFFLSLIIYYDLEFVFLL